MRYYIIAGEASGDLHAGNLVKEIARLDNNSTFRGWGGDLMQSAGVDLVKHYRDLAFMGFTEILMNLRTILNNLSFCKKDILSYKPDALILVDYPGFNMRIAKWAREQGLKVIFYISPQVWAWKENRVKTIKQSVDKMLVILPFEKEFYAKWNYPVEYVGHPLVEVIDQFRNSNEYISIGNKKPIIALLPGSRKQEIQKKLPIMLAVSRSLPGYDFVVAQAPSLEKSFYEEMLKEYPDVLSVANQTYGLLSQSAAACVTSGTATLETALFGVPEVVCYKGSAISYQIAKKLIRVKYISLVNLIMDEPVVKELIQDELNPGNLLAELKLLLNDRARKQQLKDDYAALKKILGKGGNASANAAKSIVLFLGINDVEKK